MSQVEQNYSIEKLLEFIEEGILKKKGNEILKLDLQKLDNAVTKYFVICDAESTTQVSAIAQSVEEEVKKNTGENVWHKEGYDNSQWILLDYADVVVHVFQKPFREFYNIENLWADAIVSKIN